MSQVKQSDKYQQLYQKTISKSILFLAHWELTYACNLKCLHCYVSEDPKKIEFDLAKAKLVIDELKEMGCLYLVFSGGEILTRSDFFEIASYARSQGFALRLMTNATLIDQAQAKKIARLLPLAVEISIYAAGSSLHDAITGVKGSFEKSIKAVKLLRSRNIPVVFKHIVMGLNKDELSSVKLLAKDLQAEILFDFSLVQKDNGSKQPLEYRLKSQDLRHFIKSNNIPLRNSQNDDTLLCSAGLNNIFISPYLDLHPCIGLKLNLGNLRDSKLRDIWQNSQTLKSLRLLKDKDLLSCFSCEKRKSCFRCHGMAFQESGDFLAPSRFDCEVAGIVGGIINEKGGNKHE